MSLNRTSNDHCTNWGCKCGGCARYFRAVKGRLSCCGTTQFVGTACPLRRGRRRPPCAPQGGLSGEALAPQEPLPFGNASCPSPSRPSPCRHSASLRRPKSDRLLVSCARNALHQSRVSNRSSTTEGARMCCPKCPWEAGFPSQASFASGNGIVVQHTSSGARQWFACSRPGTRRALVRRRASPMPWRPRRRHSR